MTDLTVRVVVVVLAAAVVAFTLRRALRTNDSTRASDSIDLANAGEITGRVVLFSSTSCGTCEAARAVVAAVHPEFQERSWEADADALTAAGIDEVPLTVVVGRGGRARAVFRGTPSPSMLRLRILLARFI